MKVSDSASPFRNLSDGELVQRCAGDTDAVAVLISRYIPLINKYAFQFSKVLDFDDLVQEGSLGLLDAISSFRPDKDVKFSTYAAVCVRNKMLKAVEKASSQKSGGLRGNVSLSELPERADDLTPENIFIGKESLDAVMDDVKKVLSPLERRILFSHLGGMDYKTIAQNLKISQKSVDNALQRVRRKLKSIHRA